MRVSNKWDCRDDPEVQKYLNTADHLEVISEDEEEESKKDLKEDKKLSL